MEERDGKKPFIIPKTHTSNKDVVISEKPDSRNVIELFEDIKSYALEAHFDFRQNSCKSCDTIRNQKLQKLYNEKRLKMKKEQDPVERLAFHLVTYRDVASSVANDGLRCEQLSFPIDKLLGNPKDGIHLSKRPDVLLTSSGAQGLYRFGLVVCKVLLGKGYPTIPSTTNNQLVAQVNYDHHFCKIQSINKEQHHIDDLLANSLIFCYDHENFEPVSHPPQILPIAILWYDLTEKFLPELISTNISKSILNQESKKCNRKIPNGRATINTKISKSTSSVSTKSITSNSGAWGEPIQNTTISEPVPTSNVTECSVIPTTKYPSHLMVPYNRVYSAPALSVSTNIEEASMNPPPTRQTSRDPRLSRTKRETTSLSSETIPLSPQNLLSERSLSDSSSTTTKSLQSLSDEPILITKSSSLIYIPLNSSLLLIDPRLKILKQTRNIFYLELQAVKHALQQQKRLNHYHNFKSGLPPKTNYTLIPYQMREVSNDEYEHLLNDSSNTYKLNKHSNGIDYSAIRISVVDCFNFGLMKSSSSANSMYIDLEQNENKVAFEQIEMSNELIQREKQLNSQQIRLRLREKRQRRIQQQFNEKTNLDKHNLKTSLLSPSSLLANSKSYIATGKKLLKEHKISAVPSNALVPTDLLDFFSHEYKTETRSHVKQLLAELVGIFIEKYQINSNLIEEPHVDNQTIVSVIDMDLDSPSSQGLCDHDERFRIPSPPPHPPLPQPITLPPLPSTIESIVNQSMFSVALIPTLPSEPNKTFDDPSYNDRCHKLLEQLKQHTKNETKASHLHIPAKSVTNISSEEAIFSACLGQLEVSSSENSSLDDNQSPHENEDIQDEENILIPTLQDPTMNIYDDTIRSRDEFVKLLTKEAYISKSSSPAKDENKQKDSHDYSNQRRRSHDDHDNEGKQITSSERASHSLNKKTQHVKSPEKKLSSTRTVTLISNQTTISTENHTVKKEIDESIDTLNDVLDEPTHKRMKMDSISLPSPPIDEVNKQTVTDSNDLGINSSITVSIVNTVHDYRHDLNGKLRTTSRTNSIVHLTDNSKAKSSGSRSRSRSRSSSKDQHRQQRYRSPSYNSSNKPSRISSDSNKRSRNYSPLSSSSSSSRSSLHDNHRRSQQRANRTDYSSERKRSFELSNRHHYQSSKHLSNRHELFNDKSYHNPLSNIYPQRSVNDLIPPNNVHHLSQQQPVRHKRFNYNHQSVADHPRFANTNPLSSPASIIDNNYPKSPPHCRQRHSPSPVAMVDRNVNSSYNKTNYVDQNESKKVLFSNCFDSKPSYTIECLQMLLHNKINSSSEHSTETSSINETVKYSSTSLQNPDLSLKVKSDTIVSKANQTFSSNDSEKLINLIQQSRK